MAKPRVLDVLDTMITAMTAVLNAALGDTVAGQVVSGWAVTTELVDILALNGNNYLSVLWPLKPGPGPIYSPNDPYCQIPTPPTVSLVATVTIVEADYVITFSGSVPAQYNVHVVVDGQDSLTQTTPGEELSAVATAVAAALTALGIDASAASDAVTVSGVYDLLCNVGGTGSIATEVDRITRLVQVSTYASNPMARSLVDDAIVENFGTLASMWFTLSDGQALHVRHAGGGQDYIEKAQSSYSAYEAHQFFRVEYPIISVAPATQIGVAELTLHTGTVSKTAFFGSS